MDKQFEEQIKQLQTASPLEIPYIIEDIELRDKQSAYELFDKICQEFDKESTIDNVVNPVISTVIDGVLALKCFKGISSKLGLSAQRVMNECKDFNYEGKMSYWMPDSFVEHRNQSDSASLWADQHRPEYVRSIYQNTTEMNRYKKKKIQENGSRVNMEDEYRMTKDITGTKATADKRRNDPKNLHNAETDHIVPLASLFAEVQANSALSDGDIRRIANQDYNFAVTGRMVNNPKRDMSNSEFIRKQDELKAAGKPYVELSEEQRANMIRMEKEAAQAIEGSINETVLKNLSAQGQADRKERVDAHKKREAELGRKLTETERKEVDAKLARQKAYDIHKGNVARAGKQSLLYAVGNILLIGIKPIYYEIKDGIISGFKDGVCADSYAEAFKIRFSRIKNYIWNKILNIKEEIGGGVLDFLKNFISSLIEGLIGMFVGIFKQILRVVKEGIKVFMQASSVLFGENAKKMSANEKGDAIVKILGGSVVALCGIGIEKLLDNIPGLDEDTKRVISTLLAGLASILFFYALDKADLFNVKAERRNKRIDEVFSLRIAEMKEKTIMMEKTTLEAIRSSYEKTTNMLNNITLAAEREDYESLNKSLDLLTAYLFPDNASTTANKNSVNWDC